MKFTSVHLKILLICTTILLVASLIYYTRTKEPERPPMTVQEKKSHFKALIVPAVNDAYLELMAQYQAVEKSIKSGKEKGKIEQLKRDYKVTSDAELLMALKPHPRSIAIAQAAMESAWATSRFFTQANNVFGVWSFDEDEPRIAALQKRGNKTIWVKKYPSVKASIMDYYRTLGRGDAYKAFRKLKMETNDPHLLVKKLDSYSEKGAEYGRELTAIINYNKFYQYDH